MISSEKIQDISNKIRKMASDTPLGDLEKNINALLQSAFTKLELVSRDEFDVQADLLRLTRQKLDLLQTQLDDLQSSMAEQTSLLQKNNK